MMTTIHCCFFLFIGAYEHRMPRQRAVTRVSSGKRRECLWQKKTDERVTDEKVVEIEMEIF